MGWIPALLACGAVMAAPQDPGSEPDDSTVIAWDLDDPVNRMESRLYFSQLWDAQDSGAPVPPFSFSNEPPSLLTALLLPELELFSHLYAHRLNLELGSPSGYYVLDLLRDDPAVRHQFRSYVLTGRLSPDPALDPLCWMHHFLLVTDALGACATATVSDVEVVNGLLESSDLSLIGTEPFDEPSPEGDDPSTSAEMRCWLKNVLARSRPSKCLRPLYVRAHDPQTPDMDCDDFADAFIRFVLHLGAGAWEARYGLATWMCMQDGHWVSRGHVVAVFKDPQGRWWWVDPHKGTVAGPFDSEGAVIRAIDQRFRGGDGCRHLATPIGDHLRPVTNDGLYGIVGEARPWWTSSARRESFCQKLTACCATAVPPPCQLPEGLQLAPTVGCNIRDYMPQPLPEWRTEEWGPLEDCDVGPQ